MKESIDIVAGKQRENLLKATQWLPLTERMNSPLERFITGQR